MSPLQADPGNKSPYSNGQSQFPRFSEFPAEIRILIWENVIPDDVPEVHIVTPSTITPQTYPVVDISFPSAMHSCREARQAISRQLEMRACPVKEPGFPLEIPCRKFRPDLDVMFVGAFHFYAFFSRPEFFYGGLARQLKHVATDIVLASSASRIASVLHYLDGLQTVSIVFARPGENHFPGEALATQGDLLKRCRLRAFTDHEYDSTAVGNRPRPRNYSSVRKYLPGVQREIGQALKKGISILAEETTVSAWDYDKGELKSEFKIGALGFEEYTDGKWQVKQRQQIHFIA